MFKAIYNHVNSITNKYYKFTTISYYFFLKHLSGSDSEILEFDCLITRSLSVQLFTIRPKGRIFFPLNAVPKFRS